MQTCAIAVSRVFDSKAFSSLDTVLFAEDVISRMIYFALEVFGFATFDVMSVVSNSFEDINRISNVIVFSYR